MFRLHLPFLVLLLLLSWLPSHASERVLMHCDRSLYAAGERLWFRAWVLDDASGEAVSPPSKFIYVELLRDGIGSVERRIKVKERSGMFIGQMDLPDDLESGWYTLRAYTLAQREWPAAEMFHTRLLIRGAGLVRELYRSLPEGFPTGETEKGTGVDVSIEHSSDGHLSVYLRDAAGRPLAGNFSLSVVSSSYAGFDFQTPLEQLHASPAARYPEREREYSQTLDFLVKSVRGRLPEQYGVAIMSQDIGYYFSTEVAGDRSIRGDEGQSFRIPDLDYPEETLFTVNVTGSRFLYPAGAEETFAGPYDYGPTWPAREMQVDTALIRERLEGTVVPLPSDDTLAASVITSERKPAYYRPGRVVGPYSNVFEWRQVKLREELQKYDDMDLMSYIAAHFPGLVATSSIDGISSGRTMYTTRSGSITQRVVVSHGQATYKNTVGYNPVVLYIDGNREPDWDYAASMTVSDIQNLYVLRGAEASLYKAAAVVLLEMRHFDGKKLLEKDESPKATTGLLPLGYQKPEAFPADRPGDGRRNGTIYWNPCIRTDASGKADIGLPAVPESHYIRLEGRTLDGRFFSATLLSGRDI